MKSPSSPHIEKRALLLQALVGFLIQKIASDLYASISKKIKRMAVKYLHNQFILNFIARHDRDEQIRALAAEKVNSPILLRRLLLKEKKDSVRLAILGRLTTSDAVREYKHSKRKAYKLQLIPMLKTQSGLCESALDESDLGLVKKLLHGVTDPKLIAKLSHHSLSWVEAWSKERLEWAKRRDESPLDMVMRELDPKPSLLLQVHNPKELYQIATLHKNTQARMDAISRLEGNPSYLARVMRSKRMSADARLYAAKLLGGCRELVTVATTSPNPEMRARAIALLDPKKYADAITSVMKYEKKSDVLTQAILVTTSENDLAILKKRIDPKVSPHLLKILEEREQSLASQPTSNPTSSD